MAKKARTTEKTGVVAVRAAILAIGCALVALVTIEASSLFASVPTAPGAAARPAPVAARATTDVAKPVAAKPATPVPAPVQTASEPTPDATYTVKRILPIAGPMQHGEYHWDEAGVPAGPMVITVDLAAQVLSVFRGGYEIGTAVIIFGGEVKPTPLGVFAISQKDAHHVSNLYGAKMPYMLRLTNDGISIHASKVNPALMTHGCVGVPEAFAQKLFGSVTVGDRVIVTRGETLKLGEAIKAA